MALPEEQSWPYNNQPVNEPEWRKMGRLWRETGVVEGVDDQLVVEAVTGALQVRVRAGEGWVDGHYYRLAGPVLLDVATADLDNPRIDRVVVRSDSDDAGGGAGAEALLVVLTGTPALDPQPPALTQTDGLFELPLAQFVVRAAAGEVQPGDITDERRFSQVVGGVSFVADAAERDALDNLYRGRIIFRQDLERFETYDGAAWVPTTSAHQHGHGDLTGTANANSHPIGAVTSLQPALDAKTARVGGDLRGYREPSATPGNTGTVTLNFSTHNVWEITPTGAITIAYAGLPPAGQNAAGTLIVHNSNHAITWPAGTQFPGGAAPELDGKTYLSLVVERGGTVVVGAAWAAVA